MSTKVRFIFAHEERKDGVSTLYKVNEIAEVDDDLGRALIKVGKAEPAPKPAAKDPAKDKE